MEKNNVNLSITKGCLVTCTTSTVPTALSVGTNGQMLVANSAASVGISWADVPTTAISPFVPAVQGSTGAGTATYAVQEGSFVTIGSLIIVWFFVQFSSFTGTGNIQITLPTAVGASQAGFALGPCTYTGGYTAGDNVLLTAASGNSFATILNYGSTVSPVSQECTAVSSIRGTFTYLTN